MGTVTYYFHESGKIAAVYSGLCLESMDEVYAGCNRVEGAFDGSTYYILNGEPAERPASPVTRTGLVLSNVPTGSTLFINGESYAAEGTVDLEFPLPGRYSLRVERFPFLDWSDEVVV